MSFILTAKNALEQVQKMQKRIAALKYLNTHTVDVGLPSTVPGIPVSCWGFTNMDHRLCIFRPGR